MDPHFQADFFYNSSRNLFNLDNFEPEFEASILSRNVTGMFDDYN